MGYDEEFSRKLARAGFVGMMLPREYGGSARSPFARFVVVEELLKAVPEFTRVDEKLAWMPSSNFRSPRALRLAKP